MSEFKMPELPEPQGHSWEYGQYGHGRYEPNGDFTEDQLREYGHLCAQQMREVCAKEVEEALALVGFPDTPQFEGDTRHITKQAARGIIAAIRSIEVGGEHAG